MIKRKPKFKNVGQLSFDFALPKEPDRNFHLGGKSFYFFDFDDNVAFLSTPLVLFHKKTGEERHISSGEYAHFHKDIGKVGAYCDYFVDYDDHKGSFRYCRDQKFSTIDKIKGAKQAFIRDIENALKEQDHVWKAPSWNCFYHATYNQRPVSIITARGHHPNTIKDGIRIMVDEGHLPHDPNYHTIYPVSHIETRTNLGDKELTLSVAELKRKAIRESVDKAVKEYGHSPFHRFGMSDDDPKNVELIMEEMRTLKSDYPEMSFFVIHTHRDSFSKYEILMHETRELISEKESRADQLSLFEL